MYKYAVNLPCDWVIITNIRQVRLYYKGATQQTYERFDTERLATDPSQLKRLVFLLGAERVLPASGRCHLYELLAASERAGRELTDQFYGAYAVLRREVFDALSAANPAVDRHAVLSATQKILDRLLFCAFSEDRGLLPPQTIQAAYQNEDKYNPRPIWDNFKGLFNAVNRGNPRLSIPKYNGGLFADDAVLDAMVVPDDVSQKLAVLGDYDYRPAHEAAEDAAGDQEQGTHNPLVDVDILGHIFEQSISDLERLRESLGADGAPPPEPKPEKNDRKSRRKREGAFYTPAFITRYIVEQAMGGVLKDRFEQLRQLHRRAAAEADEKNRHIPKTERVLDDPDAYDRGRLSEPQRKALVTFWEAWQEELGRFRLLDPACGSGAFLVEAFDQLYETYERSNDRLADLRGHRTLFDLDRQILQNNLYGVDLNEEAIEICKLSLWIKTAERGKELTSLDATIRVGNSVVDDPAVHPRAFDWPGAFPDVFAAGGFDVVIGNPPYVRQELLSSIKPHLELKFASYHGMADLYVYFYELALRVLRPGGRLSLIVTNKWLKAGYAEPLRKHLAEESWVESLVDFGHAKQIFEDADVFPCILVAKKPVNGNAAPAPLPRVAVIPREQLRIDDLSRQIEQEATEINSPLGAAPWQLEVEGVPKLMAKIAAAGVPLVKYSPLKPLRGITTGLNEAFIISSATRAKIVRDDPASDRLIRPCLRGQDIDRWRVDNAGLWMIVLKSSENFRWPWSDAGDDAERMFRESYPGIYHHMVPMRDALIKRQDQGRFWWELRSCAFWDAFGRPKIWFQQIQYHPSYAYDPSEMYGNNKTTFFATDDTYLLAVLNSPLMWWYNWRFLPHMKDEALAPVAYQMELLPIAPPTDKQRDEAAVSVRRLIEITDTSRASTRTILDWLKVEFDVTKPTLKLQSPADLDADAFVAEVKKSRGKAKAKTMTAAALATLREEYARTLAPLRAQAAEALTLERKLSDLVNAAYGLTPDDEKLMWDTAPPRTPLAPPPAS